MFKHLIGSILMTIGLQANAAEVYKMEDIQALVKSGGWQEILDKAKKVPPSSRTDEWQKAITQAATKVIQEPGKSPLEVVVSSNRALKEYPHLKSSPEYMKVRGAEGLKAYQRCFDYVSIASECNQELLTFVKADPTNDDLAFNAGKMSTKAFSTKSSAMPYFHQALNGKKADPRCDDDHLIQVLQASLDSGATAEEAKMAKEVSLSACSKMKPESVRRIIASEGGLKALCPAMAPNLSGVQQKKCREVKP